MKTRLARFAVLLVALACSARGANEAPETPKTSMKDVLKARATEDAKKAPATKPTPPAATPKATTPAASPAKTDPAAAKAATQNAGKEDPTVLPKVEVRKERITELDQRISEQERAIARERKKVKPSETDTALNDAKVAQPLAIFGGESAQFRQRVASERVELLEAEKDILEAMKMAKTKEEKKDLETQLEQIKAFRRDLEKSLR